MSAAFAAVLVTPAFVLVCIAASFACGYWQSQIDQRTGRRQWLRFLVPIFVALLLLVTACSATVSSKPQVSAVGSSSTVSTAVVVKHGRSGATPAVETPSTMFLSVVCHDRRGFVFRTDPVTAHKIGCTP